MKLVWSTIIMFCLMLMWISMHESTHAVIFWEYGCENVTFAIMPNAWALATTSAQCGNLLPEQRISLDHAQAINEIIGYNIVPLLILIICLMLFGRIKDKGD